MGPAVLERAAKRVPSGETFSLQLSLFGPRAIRKSSAPRPFRGLKAETVNCLPSSVGSPIAHNSDGDLAQVSELSGLAVNSGCGGPPSTDARITGSGPLMGQGPFSLSPK